MNLNILFCFAIATVISFIGSIQPGPVNLKVIQTSYHKGLRSALIVASGGVMPELIYSAIALWFSVFVISHTIFPEILNVVTILCLFFYGLYSISRKNTNNKTDSPGKASLFTFGFFAGAINPMLFTFWILVINSLVTENIIKLDYWISGLAFISGTATGAFLLLILVAWIARRNKQILSRMLSGNMDRAIGIIFIILAAIHFLKMVL